MIKSSLIKITYLTRPISEVVEGGEVWRRKTLLYKRPVQDLVVGYSLGSVYLQQNLTYVYGARPAMAPDR